MFCLRFDQMLGEPRHGLQKGLLLCEPLPRHGGIPPDGETVLHPRKHINLPRLPCPPQDDLGLVPLVGRKDVVRFGRGDGQRARDARELVGVDKRRVGDEAAVDAVGVVADDVLEKC